MTLNNDINELITKLASASKTSEELIKANIEELLSQGKADEMELKRLIGCIIDL